MAKRKQKNAQLTSLQKAFALAAKFPSLQPSMFRNILTDFKTKNADKRRSFGYEDCPAVKPKQDASNYDLWARHRQADSLQFMFGLARDLMLEYWYKNKRVFICSQELIEYVTQKFPFKFLTGELYMWLYHVCSEPLYLEFPDGLPVSEQTADNGVVAPPRVLQGAFWGQAYLQNDEYMYGKLCCPTIGIQVTSEAQFMTVHFNPIDTIQDFIEKDDVDPYQKTALSILLYLRFVYDKEDAIGSVLIPKTRQGTKECYEVRPVPFLDSIPNKDDPASIVAAGLCTSFGYLSRRNMVDALLKVRNAIPTDQPYDFRTAGDEASKLFLQCKTCNMILMWEQYRTVYQYNEKTLHALTDKYLDDVSLFGFSPELLRYFPQEVIVFHQVDSGQIALLTLCDTIDADGLSSTGIGIAALAGTDLAMAVYPSNGIIRAIEGPENTVNLSVDTLIVLYHILTVYQQKAVKKMVKDTLTSGIPSSTDLAVVPPQPKITHVPAGEKPDPEPLAYRIGQIIEDAPFELFSVTPKTIKRQRQEEKKIRMGWKMSPHVRRPHPHRYWVGHGADKHLVVRWVDRIHVHKDETAEKTTLHQVKE